MYFVIVCIYVSQNKTKVGAHNGFLGYKWVCTPCYLYQYVMSMYIHIAGMCVSIVHVHSHIYISSY